MGGQPAGASPHSRPASLGLKALFWVHGHYVLHWHQPTVHKVVAADRSTTMNAFVTWQVHSDLKGSALAHLPSGVFTANAAWLVLAVIAFNLARAAGTVAAPDLARARTATIRRKLITVPARVATSARRIILHLPQAWPWETAWTALFDGVSDPPSAAAA